MYQQVLATATILPFQKDILRNKEIDFFCRAYKLIRFLQDFLGMPLSKSKYQQICN